MIEVLKFELSKQQLEQMPVPDRDLIILAGHALNGLHAWIKILQFSAHNDSDNSIWSIGTTYQTQLILRSLYGHIVETSAWLSRPATKALIETYLGDLQPEAFDAYEEIRQRFSIPPATKDGKSALSPLLAKLRNKYAFHFPDPKSLQNAFDYCKSDQDWSLYVSDEHSNSCYWLSELVVGSGSLSLTGVDSPEQALKDVVSETIRTGNVISEFLIGLMPAALKRQIPTLPTPRPHYLANAPDGKDFKLPFYCEGL